MERQSTILTIERPDLIVNYNGRRGWTRTTDVSMSQIYSLLRSPLRYSPMAEGLGFEPRELSPTSFQDWHLKPTRTTLDYINELYSTTQGTRRNTKPPSVAEHSYCHDMDLLQ